MNVSQTATLRGQPSTHTITPSRMRERLMIRHRSRLTVSLSLLLAGGSLFGACQARFRAKDLLFTLLSPDTIAGLILEGSAGSAAGSTSSP